jgi:hypothetical protein
MLEALGALGGVVKGLAALVPFVVLYLLGRGTAKRDEAERKAKVLKEQRDAIRNRPSSPDDVLDRL